MTQSDSDGLPTMGEQYESEISMSDNRINGDNDDISERAPMAADPMQSLPLKPPYLQRMLVEADELDQRGQKLSAFMNSNPAFKVLPDRERFLMHIQQRAMGSYYAALRERIQRAEDPAWAAEYDLKEAQAAKETTDGNG